MGWLMPKVDYCTHYVYFQLSEPLSPGSVQTDLFSEELSDEKETDKENSETVTVAGLKFGWIQGVLVCKLCFDVRK